MSKLKAILRLIFTSGAWYVATTSKRKHKVTASLDLELASFLQRDIQKARGILKTVQFAAHYRSDLLDNYSEYTWGNLDKHININPHKKYPGFDVNAFEIFKRHLYANKAVSAGSIVGVNTKIVNDAIVGNITPTSYSINANERFPAAKVEEQLTEFEKLLRQKFGDTFDPAYFRTQADKYRQIYTLPDIEVNDTN